MKNEAAFKKRFKEDVKRQRGFALSLAAPMISGIPDLYVIMPGCMPVLLEAKWLGNVKRDSFSRKINLTDLQVFWLTECDRITKYSAMTLIGLNYKGTNWAAIVPCGCMGSFTDAQLELGVPYVRGQGFDVEALFKKIPIPRICREGMTSTEPFTYL